MRYRLLALDLDGTLLDPYGELTDTVREAVAEARARGLHVVLCTGRRFRTALPLADELELGGEIVVNNGALVKDLGSGKTLFHHYLSSALFPDVLGLRRELAPPLVYIDTFHERVDLMTERLEHAHPYQQEYLEDHFDHVRLVDDLGAARRDDVIMVSTMGDEEPLQALRARAHERFGEGVRTHFILNKNYRGQILEIVSPVSGKWAGLQRVAERAGVAPEEIAAVGDDTNDAELLARAGLGIAMGNAVDEVQEAADEVVKSNAQGGAAEAIERVLLRL